MTTPPTSPNTPPEANIDGLVGPTHNYAGLSPGNVASLSHAGQASSPKAAALQGLAKAKFLADRGLPQLILPPQPRPDLRALAAMGFSGSNAIERAASQAPHLLAACYSSSFMWAANAATVAPSRDTTDQRVHLTPANLLANLHRALEPHQTTRVLREIFSNAEHFAVHDPLPMSPTLADEGAANHTRLEGLETNGARGGVHLFVFGKDTANPSAPTPIRFQARHTLQASQALARTNHLNTHAVFAHQTPKAIDAGVFHNDVISVGHLDTLLLHEHAYLSQQHLLDQLQQLTDSTLTIRVVTNQEVPLEDAVTSYLFNAQLLGEKGSPKTILCPTECQETPSVAALLDKLIEENVLAEALFFDLRQSMNNGGGPACLRLRLPLTTQELDAITANVRLTPGDNDPLYQSLVEWVNTHYREELHPNDLADPKLATETLDATNELANILSLESIRPQ